MFPHLPRLSTILQTVILFLCADAQLDAQEPSKTTPTDIEPLNRQRGCTLGLRFVAVPGTTALFSTYETRVRDWNKFLTAKKYPWSFQTHFKQDENHPIVGVNLQDVVTFCNWLTEKERDEGLITNAMLYRIPTPEEWDAAAGLAVARKGAVKRTAEDQLLDRQTYVWGLTWPPPPKAANYAEGEIEGYSDGFPFTAPVGQFTPSQEGIFDLAGNVWEWTDQPEVKSVPTGTLRGGSWAYFRRECLVTSYRYVVPADLRMPTIGFRLVFDDKSYTAKFLAARDKSNQESLEERIQQMRSKSGADEDAVKALRDKMAGDDVSTLPDVSKLTAAAAGNNYLNQLGLRFVPLESGSSRLICTTETRVRDFEAWLKSSGGSWSKKPPFLLGDVHPAAGVSWDDAQAFCQWLTTKERQSVLIPEKAVYRLPTDVEWSLAAGLKDEKGSDPAQRHLGNKDHFPWPTKSPQEWSPPTLSVNLDGSPGRIANFMDNSPYTSAVDKTPANLLGLHEVGGNVSEWCQDSWPGEPDSRVIRGGSWLQFARERLLTSARDKAAKNATRADLGFRLMLDLDGAVKP